MVSWLEALRARLPRHAALIDALLEICEADERIRVLELQCSVARGAGDELSDLDMGMAARDGGWEAVVDGLPARLRAIAGTVDLLVHAIPEWGTRPHRRIFVQYVDGRQLDLVVRPIEELAGRVPGAVVLFDPDGHLTTERRPAAAEATAADLRTWEVGGWELLSNVAKYLQRDSAWEALERLAMARDAALRLWAVAQQVPYPGYGLTSLLDADPPRLPDGLEATASRIDLDELRAAALACASLLRRGAAAARSVLAPDTTESPMAAYVSDLLGSGATVPGPADESANAHRM